MKIAVAGDEKTHLTDFVIKCLPEYPLGIHLNWQYTWGMEAKNSAKKGGDTLFRETPPQIKSIPAACKETVKLLQHPD